MTILKTTTALALVGLLAACAQAPKQTSWTPDRLEHDRQCRAELRELDRDMNSALRRAYTAEAAYISTRNETVATKNKAMISQDTAALDARMADYKRRCAGGAP